VQRLVARLGVKKAFEGMLVLQNGLFNDPDCLTGIFTRADAHAIGMHAKVSDLASHFRTFDNLAQHFAECEPLKQTKNRTTLFITSCGLLRDVQGPPPTMLERHHLRQE
jgi:hypothetical protein